MKQERTPQQVIDALRAVVIRQREVLNNKSAELEKYKNLFENASKQVEILTEINQTISDRNEDLLAQVLEQCKQVENQAKKCKEFPVSTRVAVYFMLNAIREGYKFPDAEAECVFYEFCDCVGIDEADRRAYFADAEQTEPGK